MNYLTLQVKVEWEQSDNPELAKARSKTWKCAPLAICLSFGIECSYRNLHNTAIITNYTLKSTHPSINRYRPSGYPLQRQRRKRRKHQVTHRRKRHSDSNRRFIAATHVVIPTGPQTRLIGNLFQGGSNTAFRSDESRRSILAQARGLTYPWTGLTAVIWRGLWDARGLVQGSGLGEDMGLWSAPPCMVVCMYSCTCTCVTFTAARVESFLVWKEGRDCLYLCSWVSLLVHLVLLLASVR
jgi:hypothetical protein